MKICVLLELARNWYRLLSYKCMRAHTQTQRWWYTYKFLKLLSMDSAFLLYVEHMALVRHVLYVLRKAKLWSNVLP